MASITAYLGLGSNLGDRRANLNQAAQLLTSDDSIRIRLLRASSTYETAPWGYAGQPDFLNCVLEIETSSSPEGLLEWVQSLEREMGRVAGQRFGPRIIDLDILLYGDRAVDQPDLQIPHSRLHERAFVLVPLAELASGLVHPVLGVSVQNLVDKVDGKEGVRPWGPPLDLPDGERRTTSG